jgi:formate dehydrogenase subunit delta
MPEHETAIEALVRMANQIADNYASLPPDQAANAVAGHLRSFWAPSMRADLLTWCDAGGVGLDPVPLAAVGLLRAS